MTHDPMETPRHLAEIDAFYADKLETADKARPVSDLLAPDYADADLPEDLLGTSFGCGNPIAFSGVRPGDSILDLGCGVGLDLMIAAERTGPDGRVTGIDMSENMVARARANVARHGFANIEVEQGTIEALPFADGTFDWVVSNCVINLSMDKPAAFAELHRVLKPGGQMLISDIVVEDLPDWVGQHADLYAACLSGAVSERTYRALAEAAGLTTVETRDTLAYDKAALRQLIADDLPVAVGSLAGRLGLTEAAMLDKVVADLSGKVKSINLYGRKPG